MTLLINFGLMSLLILAAQLVRGRTRLFQRYCIPSAILAGFAALCCGPNGADWLPFQEPIRLADYPRVLVVILFATLFPGLRLSRKPVGALLHQVGDTFFYSLATQFGQYAVALLFGLIVLAPLFPSLNPAFALMLPSGFAGGPGAATVTAHALQRAGWDEALSVGLTFATLGQLIGVIGGMVLVNLGIRLGWTELVRSPEELPAGMATGFVPASDQSELGRETVSSSALDSLSWHIAIILSAVTLGYAAGHGLKRLWPAFDFPTFALAMLAGVLIQLLLERMGAADSIDRATINRIGAVASDYLIAFGICAIRPQIVSNYLVPLVLMATVGVVFSLGVYWFLGRRIFRNYWFERGLFTWGWNTGLVGTGVSLLRIVDPRHRSGALEDYGLAYLFIACLDVALIVLLPPIVGAGQILLPALVLLGLAIAAAVLSARLIGWFPRPLHSLRRTQRDCSWRADRIAEPATVSVSS